jgi:hypothetical protein
LFGPVPAPAATNIGAEYPSGPSLAAPFEAIEIGTCEFEIVQRVLRTFWFESVALDPFLRLLPPPPDARVKRAGTDSGH